MSLAPPSAAVGDRFRPGQFLWRLSGFTGRHKPALITLEITEICHHYAKCRQCLLDANGGARWVPADPIDCRPGGTPYLYTCETQARLEHALCTHAFGPLAARLLSGDPADSKPRRCTEWAQAIDHRSASPQKYAAALRLLIRCGRAERLPRPKRCPRYRLLPAPVPPLPEVLPGL